MTRTRASTVPKGVHSTSSTQSSGLMPLRRYDESNRSSNAGFWGGAGILRWLLGQHTRVKWRIFIVRQAAVPLPHARFPRSPCTLAQPFAGAAFFVSLDFIGHRKPNSVLFLVKRVPILFHLVFHTHTTAAHFPSAFLSSDEPPLFPPDPPHPPTRTCNGVAAAGGNRACFVAVGTLQRATLQLTHTSLARLPRCKTRSQSRAASVAAGQRTARPCTTRIER